VAAGLLVPARGCPPATDCGARHCPAVLGLSAAAAVVLAGKAILS